MPGPVVLPENLSEHEVEGAVAGTLLGWRTSPQAVVFLAEDDYVTGVCLPVDGGRTIAGGTWGRRPHGETRAGWEQVPTEGRPRPRADAEPGNRDIRDVFCPFLRDFLTLAPVLTGIRRPCRVGI